MPPGRKRQAAADEAPLTDYEKDRLANLMRINQKFQSLGVSRLKSLLNQSIKRAKKSKGKAPVAEQNKDSEGLVDQASEGNLADKSWTTNSVQSGGARCKRVMALEEHDEPARMTRQRTKELQATEEGLQGSRTDAQEGALIVADGPTQPSDQVQNCNDCNEDQENALGQRWRGRSIGKGLDQITRGLCSRIPIHVAEGQKRPAAPMQAAKLASEGGIILRQHIPILPRWKDYKEKKETYLKDYIGKVSAQFAIDTTNKAVVDACTDLLRSGQRQLRYKLKKRYFDGRLPNEVPTTSPIRSMTDDEWRALVNMWSSAKHKRKCLANKLNRERVRYHHTTGSRCYVAHAHILKEQERYKDTPPTAIDLFKEFHCSSKTGFSEPVKDAIAQMEAIVNEPAEEGHVPKTPAEAVAQVLASTKFLENAGLEPVASKRTAKAIVAARVQELEAEVEAEKQCAATLKDKLEDLEQKSEESRVKQLEEIEKLKKDNEEIRAKQLEEIEKLKNDNEEIRALVRCLLNMNKV